MTVFKLSVQFTMYRSYKPDASDVTGPLPSSADVVIIGGGVIGCSTLYHLAKLGVTNTVLVERHQLTSGTTWHTAGESVVLS